MKGHGANQIITDDAVDCAVQITALGKGDHWEAACPCGFWTKGTKAECERRANGHPPRRI